MITFKKDNKTNKLFYIIFRGKFLICDTDCISKSERTIDIPLFDIGNNKKLLNLLRLHYFEGQSYEETGRNFSCFLAAFKTEGALLQQEKSFTNPIVRVLVEDDAILNEIKNSNILQSKH